VIEVEAYRKDGGATHGRTERYHPPAGK